MEQENRVALLSVAEWVPVDLFNPWTTQKTREYPPDVSVRVVVVLLHDIQHLGPVIPCRPIEGISARQPRHATPRDLLVDGLDHRDNLGVISEQRRDLLEDGIRPLHVGGVGLPCRVRHPVTRIIVANHRCD